MMANYDATTHTDTHTHTIIIMAWRARVRQAQRGRRRASFLPTVGAMARARQVQWERGRTLLLPEHEEGDDSSGNMLCPTSTCQDHDQKAGEWKRDRMTNRPRDQMMEE